MLRIASAASGGTGRPRRRPPFRAPPRVGLLLAPWAALVWYGRRGLASRFLRRRREPPSPETAVSCSAPRGPVVGAVGRPRRKCGRVVFRRAAPLSAPSAALAGDGRVVLGTGLSAVDAVGHLRRRSRSRASHRVAPGGGPSVLAGGGRIVFRIGSIAPGGTGRPRRSGRVVLRLALVPCWRRGRPRRRWPRRALDHVVRRRRGEPPAPERPRRAPPRAGALLAPWAALSRDGRVVLCARLSAVDAVSRPRPRSRSRAPRRVDPSGGLNRPRRRRSRRASRRVNCSWRDGAPSPDMAASCSAWRRPLLAPRVALVEDGRVALPTTLPEVDAAGRPRLMEAPRGELRDARNATLSRPRLMRAPRVGGVAGMAQSAALADTGASWGASRCPGCHAEPPSPDAGASCGGRALPRMAQSAALV